MSGTYLGKVWQILITFLELYAIDNPKVIFFFMKMYEGASNTDIGRRSRQKTKAETKESLQGVEKIIPIMCKANGKK